MINSLGHNGKAGALAHLGKYLKPLILKALKAVGRRTRLKSAGAKNRGACLFDGLGDSEALLKALYGTGPGHHGYVAAAYRLASHRNHRIFRLHFSAHKLEGLGNPYGILDTFKSGKIAGINGAGIAEDTNGGALRAGHGCGGEAELFDGLYNCVYLRLRGVLFHYYKHTYLLQKHGCGHAPCMT